MTISADFGEIPSLIAEAPMETISLKYKFRIFCIFMTAYGLFYIFPNMYAKWQPQLLPLLWIDRTVPLIPWTFLIYTSDYTLILIAILLISEKERFHSFCRMMFSTLLICGSFFLLFPTTYPRPPYPLVSNPFVTAAMNLIYIADTPNNCFPSMHVALTSIATWGLRYRGKKIFLPFVLWTLAVIGSTLTTKQHYFVDILGGLGVVIVVIALEWMVFARGLFPARLPSLPKL